MSNFRSQALLDIAEQAPHCMNLGCHATNHGQVVGCHSNAQRHGKGMGLKAHDVPAYLCPDCHDIIDGRSEAFTYSKLERERMWADWMFNSMVWALQSGYLQVVANPRPQHLAPIAGRR